ncbi:MAG: hypothetical protein MGG37_07770 [Trichodesmium sp. MAG_R01]|nr:hypothetical protein [Trichodesmium sp. MAG_R01]
MRRGFLVFKGFWLKKRPILIRNNYNYGYSPTSLKQILRKLRGTPGEELTTIEVQGILEGFIEAEFLLKAL